MLKNIFKIFCDTEVDFVVFVMYIKKRDLWLFEYMKWTYKNCLKKLKKSLETICLILKKNIKNLLSFEIKVKCLLQN